MGDEPAGSAIEVVDLTKTFLIPHEQRTRFKEVFVHPLRRTTYEVNPAVQDVSFSVSAGEFFGIIGPNGSGKSTLLKLVAGIYFPDRGFVNVRGKVSPFIELGVGFNPELSARDNVLVNGILMGLTRKEIEERFDEVIAFAELERFVDQKLKNYSSGMLVRLAYSIAIQVPFDVLLLDEVLAVGDQGFAEKCLTTFERFRQEGKTVVLVTHDLASVERFCDQALYLEHGAVEAIGPTEEVIAAYAQRVEVGL
jgi:ABC-type polysaccharide/polyol phosphate transport system ATPase subunit